LFGGFDFRRGAARSLFAATRPAAANAIRPQVTSSSGSSNNRSGARQKERSMVLPFFSVVERRKGRSFLEG
jgi:hypothetical protein